jgi:hypothetical protein
MVAKHPEENPRRPVIDGATTAEADYTALHPTILYCKRGLKFDGDAYDVDGFPRDHVKRGFNIAVNSPDRCSAVYALAKRVGIGPPMQTSC